MRDLDDLGVNVSRETTEKLVEYRDLLIRWTKSINLISPNTVNDAWQRHIVDSAQLLPLAPADWRTWIDLGSGGGLPGVVVAILDQRQRSITLIESDLRKCVFLKTVSRTLDLNITVQNARIEKVDIPHADVVSARALAHLTSLLEYSSRLLQPNGTALFLKGQSFKDELEEAKNSWHFEAESFQSITNAPSALLRLTGLQRRELDPHDPS